MPHHRNDEYHVAWIYGTTIEAAASRLMFDVTHDEFMDSRSRNIFTLGSLGGHKVVMVSLDGVGTKKQAGVAICEILCSFPNVWQGLVVGVGVPDLHGDNVCDIRLGDVVVRSEGAVVLNRFGTFDTIETWNRRPKSMLTGLEVLKEIHKLHGSQITTLVDKDFEKSQDGPIVHYGTIASYPYAVEDVLTRENIKDRHSAICLEQEMVSMIEEFPTIAIRGNADYVDIHNENGWDRYSALAAAAFAKELLSAVSTADVEADPKVYPINKSAFPTFDHS